MALLVITACGTRPGTAPMAVWCRTVARTCASEILLVLLRVAARARHCPRGRAAAGLELYLEYPVFVLHVCLQVVFA